MWRCCRNIKTQYKEQLEKKKLAPDASQALVHPSPGLVMAARHCHRHCLSQLVDGLLLAVEVRGKKEEAGRMGGKSVVTDNDTKKILFALSHPTKNNYWKTP